MSDLENSVVPLVALVATLAFAFRRRLKSRLARVLATWFFGPIAALFVVLTFADSDCDIGSLAIMYRCDHLPPDLVTWISLPAFFLAYAGILLSLPALLLGAIYETAARIKT